MAERDELCGAVSPGVKIDGGMVSRRFTCTLDRDHGPLHRATATVKWSETTYAADAPGHA